MIAIAAAQVAIGPAASAGPAQRLPDLAVAEVATTPTTVAAGGRLRLAETVVNAGAAEAARSRTGYFLVRDGVKVHLGARSVRALAPRGRSRDSVQLVVPAGTVNGRYRAMACANSTHTVREATTRNNCRVARLSVRVRAILPPPPARLFWGARVGKQFTGSMPPWDLGAQAKFEETAGKHASLIHWGAPWQSCTPDCHAFAFDKLAADNARRHGAIALYDWAPYAEPDTGDDRRFALSAITGGAWDGLIRTFASEVRSWGHALFLRFAWEMNGDWFPWGAGVNGNQPESFVRAWRRVHDLFASVGATNVVWIWCPNVDPRHDWAPFAQVYPGDAYVNWTCLDGYNSGTNPRGHQSGWESFDDIYRRSYDELRKIAPSKPMMIAEVASSEFGGSKAGWIRAMFDSLPGYSQIRGLAWTNDRLDGMDWPIETSTSARDAFRTGIRNRLFSASAFGGGRASTSSGG